MGLLDMSASSAQSVKIWSKLLYRETLAYAYMFNMLKGTDKNSIIMHKTDLEKQAGDQIKYDLLLNLAGAGKEGSAMMERNVEALTYKQDSVLIDQIRWGTGHTAMTAQRSLHDFYMDSKDVLKVWFGDYIESSMFRCLCGDTSYNFAGNTGTLPDAYHYYMCGDVSVGAGSGTIEDDEALLGNNDQITLEDLDYAKAKALAAKNGGLNALRPTMVNGEAYLTLVLHPYCFTDLVANVAGSTKTTWKEIQMYANNRGLKNPIFTGAEGVYNGIVIRQSPFILNPITNVYRNVLLGAQAAVFATGNPYSKMHQKSVGKDLPMLWSEDSYDHGDKMEIVGGMVCGFKKSRFADHAGTTRDYGVVTMSAYGTDYSA